MASNIRKPQGKTKKMWGAFALFQRRIWPCDSPLRSTESAALRLANYYGDVHDVATFVAPVFIPSLHPSPVRKGRK